MARPPAWPAALVSEGRGFRPAHESLLTPASHCLEYNPLFWVCQYPSAYLVGENLKILFRFVLQVVGNNNLGGDFTRVLTLGITGVYNNGDEDLYCNSCGQTARLCH